MSAVQVQCSNNPAVWKGPEGQLTPKVGTPSPPGYSSLSVTIYNGAIVQLQGIVTPYASFGSKTMLSSPRRPIAGIRCAPCPPGHRWARPAGAAAFFFRRRVWWRL